ncbi:hypothetical protein [Nocardia sp. alder85J]|uniref:hypothetical protein n=1 Tax=Nocardia sp. alder85J TaxID=2862949 RepID=UPI001CD7F99B|nr:hypothetical protein [Nocardia sp. alder85J]MCX4097345.1 hypothetical protein [Nocardia sp. alder85J]
MRRPLFVLSLLACAALVMPLTACSHASDNSGSATAATPQEGAGPAAGQGTLKVQATTGAEQYPASGLGVGVSKCDSSASLATLTTAGHEGAATHDLPGGCYQVAATGVPSGCMLGSPSPVKVDVTPGNTSTASFQLKCA